MHPMSVFSASSCQIKLSSGTWGRAPARRACSAWGHSGARRAAAARWPRAAGFCLATTACAWNNTVQAQQNRRTRASCFSVSQNCHVQPTAPSAGPLKAMVRPSRPTEQCHRFMHCAHSRKSVNGSQWVRHTARRNISHRASSRCRAKLSQRHDLSVAHARDSEHARH